MGVKKERPKSCDVITSCANRILGLFGFSFEVESKILLCTHQVIAFQIQHCHK